MKRTTLIICLLFSIFVFMGCNNNKITKPRIAIIGIGIECSTFSPARTTIEKFNIKKGDAILSSYPFFNSDTTYFDRANWLPTVLAWATPGGMVTRQCYDSLLNMSLLELKKNMPYDALFLDIHGAMSVEGVDDPEGDYIERIREIVGDNIIISTSMDPHGCVSHRLAQRSDLITAYRMSPHEDRYISRKRAVDNMLKRLEDGSGKPKYKAWVEVPILLPGEKTSTRVEPGKSLYEAIVPIEKTEGVVDAAIWMSYPWADEPRNHAVVMVVGDDLPAVEEGAKILAEKFWSVRNEFLFVAPTSTLDAVMDSAIKSDKKPYFVSDMGDNPTAGGAGDVTWTLEQLINNQKIKKIQNKRIIYASIPGANLVAAAKEAGIGANIKGRVGAMVDDRYASPVEIEGTVEYILNRERNSQVVVRMGALQIIVTEERTPFHYEKNFDELNLKPREADIIVVKLGYLTEELYEMRGDWMMAHTRGGVDQELTQLPYKRIKRPIFPLDDKMVTPALKVVLIP